MLLGTGQGGRFCIRASDHEELTVRPLLLSLCAAGALALTGSPAKADPPYYWHGPGHHDRWDRRYYNPGWRYSNPGWGYYNPGYSYRYYAPYSYYRGYYANPYSYGSYYYGPGWSFGYSGPRASVWFGF
jgi:hypothetical protein